MISFTDHGWDDSTSWTGDRKTLARINRMIEEADRDPGIGIGKPERLAGDLSGCWSRRIDHAHRLVYKVVNGDLIVLQARYHY